MSRPAIKVAFLLLGSGASSLIYETVWLRELRLIFGASTMASAAVVACFVGGLGAGALLLGKRADAHPRPLEMYSWLEGGIALASAATPVLLVAVRAAYVALGGTRALGFVGGSALRLALAAVVFTVPTLLMGGTLAAASRAVETEDDRGRRRVALLYGANTLGAVTGCMASTFVLFEIFGTRLTLWIACLVNALLAVLARSLSRTMPPPVDRKEALEDRSRAAPAWFVLLAAVVVGFVFCLLELVWYRMLGPVLGGTVFSFGLILAVALLGIGLGGIAYSLLAPSRETTLTAFAWSSVVEGLFVAIPYALGDRLAILAAVLRPLGGLSFGLQIAEWTVVTSLVVLPAAILSGVQFPLLIGLLGRGDKAVGRDVGRATAANALGAIAGSLVGGFGLLPLLTAPGCWRLVVWLLLALGAGAVALEARRRPAVALAPLLAGLLAIACLRATGPTAAWRHTPIGAGRVDANLLRTPNGVRAWENEQRRTVAWEADGRESSVAIVHEDGVAFVVNGKSDGNAVRDAPTALMSGILGATLVPHPSRAMVIGLGTGETAGWLGAIDTMTRVDVAEIEPAVLEVARRSEAVNHRVLENPKVHIELGDARELLLTSKERYDVIASEPSNPYRAGIASLFTREYYEAVASRLDADGVFIQWLQGYEVDASTVRTVMATLASVFPEVETWELGPLDLAFVCAKKPLIQDGARIRARLGQETYRSAVTRTWRTTDLEGFLSHFVANGDLVREVAREEGDAINTDDDNIVEFGLARTVGEREAAFSVDDMRLSARRLGEHRPRLLDATVDWNRVDDGVADLRLAGNYSPLYFAPDSPGRAHRIASLKAYSDGRPLRAAAEWRAQPSDPVGPTETAIIASVFAEAGDEKSLMYAEALRHDAPSEADAIIAHFLLRTEKPDEAAAHLEAFFANLHDDPWPMQELITTALHEAKYLAAHDARFAPPLFAALREPFALSVRDVARRQVLTEIAMHLPGSTCVAAYEPFEPDVPWNEAFLAGRRNCYVAAHNASAERAQEELVEWLAAGSPPFAAGLKQPQ
jgi:predicted membrane-bound spermidine synthase